MNKWLTGNGYWCPTCNGTGRGLARDRIEYEGGGYAQFYDRCMTCNGDKRIAATADQIITCEVPVTPSPKAHTAMPGCVEYGHSGDTP